MVVVVFLFVFVCFLFCFVLLGGGGSFVCVCVCFLPPPPHPHPRCVLFFVVVVWGRGWGAFFIVWCEDFFFFLGGGELFICFCFVLKYPFWNTLAYITGTPGCLSFQRSPDDYSEIRFHFERHILK